MVWLFNLRIVKLQPLLRLKAGTPRDLSQFFHFILSRMGRVYEVAADICTSTSYRKEAAINTLLTILDDANFGVK